MAKLWRAKHLLAISFLVAVTAATPATQTQRSSAQGNTPYDAARFSLNAGKYDDVERLLRDDMDPRAFALRARALVARGRYQDAEKLLTAPAAAQPGSDAALELGRLQMLLGRRMEARQTLSRLVESVRPASSSDYLRLALADEALGEFGDANDNFRDANRRAPDDAVVNAAWGDMFREKGETGDAQKSYQVALKSDPSNVDALVGMALLLEDENPPQAAAAAMQALKVNPSYVPAHLLIAEMAMDDRHRDDAKMSIKAALDVNPNSLEARSLDAAMAFLEGRDQEYEAKAADVLKINPKYGEVYRVVGDHAARNYRFQEATALARKAIAIDPENTKAYKDLGMNLLRTGDEPGARVALETAFKADPYRSSLVTKNLLELLDKLDTFQTVTDGDLIVRLDPEEAGVMREQVPAFAKQALAKLEQLWNFTPQGPILIEMFPVHDDFAVRNLGLPGMIGALGACFGKVVTLDSPHARPPGEYNWRPTLWHELAHVITLQLSNNRVPRWLTEGISVWEERRAAPEWGREMEVSFAHALDQNKVMKLKVLNDGFSDPQLISLAYYEASLVAEHLANTYGMDKLRELLRAYGRGLETDEAVKQVYGVTLDDIQASFDAHIAERYAPLRAALKTPKVQGEVGPDDVKKLAEQNPGSFPVQMLLGETLYKTGDKAGAIAAYERAAKLVPAANGDDNPNKRIAQIAIEQKDTARAIEALEAVIRVDHDDVESARTLASLLAPMGDAAKTEDAYRRLVAVDPFDVQAETAYGRLTLKRKDTGDAIVAFRTALAANPPDRAAAHLDLAQAYVAAGRPQDAKKEALAALEIAPAYEPAQDLLLKIVDAGGGGA
jgi:tetratricopeptide (TPR) repeat protein